MLPGFSDAFGHRGGFLQSIFCNLELPVGWLVFCSTIVWYIIQIFELGWLLFTVYLINDVISRIYKEFKIVGVVLLRFFLRK